MTTWPALTFLGLSIFSTGIIAAKHGQEHSPYNIGATLIGDAILLFLLFEGGFFAPLGWTP